jgi:hypothetical protein
LGEFISALSVSVCRFLDTLPQHERRSSLIAVAALTAASLHAQ